MYLAHTELFPRECMDNLSTIVARTGATIVLSSTWRKRHDWHQDIIDAFGAYQEARISDAHGSEATPLCKQLKIEKFEYMTPILQTNNRGEEIRAWLPARKGGTQVTNGEPESGHTHTLNIRIRSWVALDDEDLMEAPENMQYGTSFEGHYVKINPVVGLTSQNASDAIAMLMKDRTVTPK